MLDELHARHLVGVADVREVWLIRHADAYVGLESLNEGVLDPPLSSVGLDQALGDGQAQTGATRGTRLDEPLEHVGKNLGRDARPGILHGEGDGRIALPRLG